MVWYSLAASYARIQGIFPSSPRDVRCEMRTSLLRSLVLANNCKSTQC